MDIINDTPLMLNSLPFQVTPGVLTASFFVKGTFQLVPGETARFAEEPDFPTGDIPYDDHPEESVRYDSDFVPFKPKTDLLLVGSCHVPGGKPVEACDVTFHVGSFHKGLVVIGERSRKKSSPKPFKKMPIRYERAYGGPGFGRNPLGRGVKTEALPNIGTSSLPESSREPAGFGPIPNTWPQRMSKVGSFNRKWLKERWPWLPGDFDWTYFNGAPEDQQLDGYLRGDEELAFGNLHPEHPMYACRLPGVVPQVFVRKKGNLEEVPLNLDTLYVDMDREKVILVWRGLTAVETIRMNEIEEAHVTCRKLEESGLTGKAYEERLAEERRREQEEEERERVLLEDEEKASEESWTQFDEEMSQAEKEIEKTRAELQASAGISEEAFSPKPMSLEAAVKQFNENMGSLMAEIPESGKKFTPMEVPPEWLEEDAPPWTRERCREHEGSFSGEDLSGLDLSDLDLQGRDFREATLTGVNLKGSNLAGADLSEADLSKANLDGADLSEASLVRADLTGATLRMANLTRANCEEATLRETSLEEARLEEAVCTRTDFSDSNLGKALLRKSKLTQADFSRCVLEEADFTEALLDNACVEGAKGHRIKMDDADLTGLRAAGIPDFTGGSFLRVKGEGSYWGGAILPRTDFRFASLNHADFSETDLRGARLDAVELREGCFDDADLEDASLARTDVFRGSFVRARLIKTDLGEANLFEAEFWDAVLHKTNLQGANIKRTKIE